MQQDALPFARIVFQVAIEDNQPLADAGGGVRRIAGRIAEIRAIADFHRAAMK